jgi:DNA-binding LacI/PurR family transcriptional regulator
MVTMRDVAALADGYRAALRDHGIDNNDSLVSLGAFDRASAA